MSENDESLGWRKYREYCSEEPDYWKRIENLAVNLHLPPFNFPFGAENQASFEG